MLGWALAEHPDFGGCPEIDFIYELAGRNALRRSWERSQRQDGFLAHFSVPYERYAAGVGRGFEAVMRAEVEAAVLVDATPRHVLIGAELALLFPQARFLHLVRRGEDVVRSLVASGFASRSASGFIPACVTYRRYLEAGLGLEEALADRILRVRYEEIVADPATAMQRLHAFIGSEPHEACARFIEERRINASFGDSFDARGERRQKPKRPPLGPLQRLLYGALCGGVARRVESSEPGSDR